MKRKNKEVTFGGFLVTWIALHIVALLVMVAIDIVLLIPILPQLGDMVNRKSIMPSNVYAALLPFIVFIVPLMGLAVMQARTSSNTLHVLPKSWSLYSSVGILCAAAVYTVVTVAGLMTTERPGPVLIGLLLIGMGTAETLLLVRRYSLLGSLGWLLSHAVTAGLLIAPLDSRYLWLVFLLFTISTGALCWYLYKSSPSEGMQSQDL